MEGSSPERQDMHSGIEDFGAFLGAI